MILFSPSIWPFFLIGMSMLITYLTALDLPSKLRRSRRISPAGEGDSRAPAIVTAKLPVSVRIVRNGGIFWFCAGVGTLVYTLTPERWNQPGAWTYSFVGLIWVVLGMTMFRSTFPRRVVRIHPSGEGIPLHQIVTHLADRACASGQVGIVVGAIAGKEEFLHGFGSVRLGATQPPDAETFFEIGSISKVFTGILLARAIESGKLGLEDRIANLLPEGWTLPEPAWPITLRHCTTHTSGLPRLPANLLNFANAVRLAYFGNDPYRDYTEEKFREALARSNSITSRGPRTTTQTSAPGCSGRSCPSQRIGLRVGGYGKHLPAPWDARNRHRRRRADLQSSAFNISADPQAGPDELRAEERRVAVSESSRRRRCHPLDGPRYDDVPQGEHGPRFEPDRRGNPPITSGAVPS